MQWEVLIGGAGGQGVLLAGEILARAALLEGRYASCLAAYGPEVRGGTANCTTIVSEEEIITPLVPRPSAVMAFNQLSYERFKDVVAPKGILLVNASLVKMDDRKKRDPELRVVNIPINDIALDLGNLRVLNIVALGAYIELSGAVKLESLVSALEDQLGEKKHLIHINRRAIECGMESVRTTR